MELDVYTTKVTGWATSIEAVAPLPTDGSERLTLALPSNTLFFTAVASTPEGARPPWLDVRLNLDDPRHDLGPGIIDDDNWYADPELGLFVLNRCNVGGWGLMIRSVGRMPFAIHAMAFHPALPSQSPPLPSPSGTPPIKCRACKITAKALSLSIIVAASLPAIPSALLAAVATYLGASVAVAAAFVSSVLGDTADIIAEKLCRHVGFC